MFVYPTLYVFLETQDGWLAKKIDRVLAAKHDGVYPTCAMPLKGIRATKMGHKCCEVGGDVLFRGLLCRRQLRWDEIVFAQEALSAFGFRLAVLAFSYPFKKVAEETEDVEVQVGGPNAHELILY